MNWSWYTPRKYPPRSFYSPDMMTWRRLWIRPPRDRLEMDILWMYHPYKFPIVCRCLRRGGVCILPWLIMVTDIFNPMTMLEAFIISSTSWNYLDNGSWSIWVSQLRFPLSPCHIYQTTSAWDPGHKNSVIKPVILVMDGNIYPGCFLTSHSDASIIIESSSTPSTVMGTTPKCLVVLYRGDR